MRGQRIAIVLVGPRGDANIGACARAMKNFGLTDLCLVDPIQHITEVAYTWAVGARDVLEKAKIFTTLDDALGEASCAVAFTRRTGRLRRRHMTLDEAAPWIINKAAAGKVSLIFGRESDGLTNNEIKRCDVTVSITTSEALPTLNLAQAVLITCHELYRISCGPIGAGQTLAWPMEGHRHDQTEEQFISQRQREDVIRRLNAMLEALGYDDPPSSPLRSKIVHHFERIFGRGGLTRRDAGMMEGLIERIISKIAGCY